MHPHHHRQQRHPWLGTCRHIAVGAAVAGMLAGCNGDDGVADTTTTSAPGVTTTVATTSPSTSAPSSVASTTSSPAPTSTTAPPTTAASTAPTTLDGGTTGTDIEQIRSDVVDAANAAYEAFDAIRQDPTDERALQAMSETMTEAYIDDLRERFIIPYLTNGLIERTNPDLPARYDLMPETFALDPGGQTATIRACYLSSNLLYELGGNDDGTDKLQDSRFGAVLTETRMVLVDGRWLDDGGVSLNTSVGKVQCEE